MSNGGERMDSTYYMTVYDVARVPALDPGFVIIPLILVAVAGGTLTLWWRGWRPKPGIAGADRLPLLCMLVCALAPAVALVGVMQATSTRDLQSALAGGRYERVEGRIENFVRGNNGINESFSLTTGTGVHRYAYNASSQIPGFHQSAGPLSAGMEVRIADVKGSIARLEIRQGPGQPAVPHRYRWLDLTNPPNRSR